MNKLVFTAGVDEAGRGCVLGPMVMGVCVIDKSRQVFFKEIGCKDSKLLTPKKREELAEIIKKEAIEYKIIVVPAEELNVLMSHFSLNEIEAQKISEMIFSLKTELSEIVIDSPDTVPEKFKNRIQDDLKRKGYKDIKKLKIVSEHKADVNHVSVSCASILAKVMRDKLIHELIGDISGYSSDPKTIEYLKAYILKNKELPTFARVHWETIDKVMKELYQKKISGFK
jgi:ribonuclease HII